MSSLKAFKKKKSPNKANKSTTKWSKETIKKKLTHKTFGFILVEESTIPYAVTMKSIIRNNNMWHVTFAKIL